MKRYIKNFMMAMMVGATVFGSSCTDSFEEVNTDDRMCNIKNTPEDSS